jgi:hypothetical protein
MMPMAEWNTELISVLLLHCPFLREGQVMCFSLTPANQTRLRPDVSQVFLRPKPEWFL